MVYLLHFTDGKGGTAGLRRSSGQVIHYLGYTPDERRSWDNSRIQKHLKGQGARLTQVWRERGGGLMVAAWWPGGDRQLERKLKSQHNHRRYCPICQAEARRARGDSPLDQLGW